MTALPTYPSATDEILGLFRAAWNANSPAVNGGTAPPVQYPAVPSAEADAPVNSAFARIRIGYRPSSQSTFGTTGSRRFTRNGNVFVQVFAPLSNGQALSLAENLAIIARNAYEGVGTASGIIFRNFAVAPIGVSGAWYQINVSGEFEYDEVR